jgi:hypothetical protein
LLYFLLYFSSIPTWSLLLTKRQLIRLFIFEKYIIINPLGSMWPVFDDKQKMNGLLLKEPVTSNTGT